MDHDTFGKVVQKDCPPTRMLRKVTARPQKQCVTTKILDEQRLDIRKKQDRGID
jgi:hypothetical protein